MKTKTHIGLVAAMLIAFTGTAALAASGKGEIKATFKEKTAICEVVKPYMEKCELEAASTGQVVTVEGTLPKNLSKDAVVLLKAKEAGKCAGIVADIKGTDKIMELAEEAAAQELAGKAAIIWIDQEANKAALIQLEEAKDFAPGERIKIKAKRKAPVVEGC